MLESMKNKVNKNDDKREGNVLQAVQALSDMTIAKKPSPIGFVEEKTILAKKMTIASQEFASRSNIHTSSSI